MVLTFLLKPADFVCFAFNAANMRLTTPERGIVLGGGHFKDHYQYR